MTGCAAGYMPELNVLCGIADYRPDKRAAGDQACLAWRFGPVLVY